MWAGGAREARIESSAIGCSSHRAAARRIKVTAMMATTKPSGVKMTAGRAATPGTNAAKTTRAAPRMTSDLWRRNRAIGLILSPFLIHRDRTPKMLYRREKGGVPCNCFLGPTFVRTDEEWDGWPALNSSRRPEKS